MAEPRKFKMTKKRAAWVGNKKTTLRGTPMRVNSRSVDRLSNEAQMMVREMHLDVSKQVNALFNSHTARNSIAKKPAKITVESSAMDASIASQSRILMNVLINKWTKKFGIFSNKFAKSMVANVDGQSQRDIRKVTEKLSGGISVSTSSLSERTRDIIIASTDESASLIKSIGSDYTQSIKEALSRSISSNEGSLTSLKKLVNDSLQGKYKTQRNKAKNVAIDQTKKAYTNIAASRMRDAGLDDYIWRHAAGSKEPRKHHKYDLNGKVFSLSKPPIIDEKTGRRGKPGDDYNCSCYMEPVITFG